MVTTMVQTSADPALTDFKTNDPPLMATMSTTRAMRRLAPDPVPDHLLLQLVEAATWAPTANNAQAVSYVLVTDREVMARLALIWRKAVDAYLAMDLAKQGGHRDEASRRIVAAIEYERDHFAATPALVVVCYDNHAVERAMRSPTVVKDALRSMGLRRFVRISLSSRRFAAKSEDASVYPGVENLLLAARGLGLAACMTTWHLLYEAEFKAALGIPAGIGTFAVVPIGWPLGRFGPVVRRPAETYIRRNGWDGLAASPR